MILNGKRNKTKGLSEAKELQAKQIYADNFSLGLLMMAMIEDENLPEAEEYIYSKDGVDYIPSSTFLSLW